MLEPHGSPFVQGIATLNPAYFAMVMATGIVSIACHLLDMRWLALPLFWLNILAYVVLVTLTGARLAMFPQAFFADLIDHKRGVGFFTMVAATCVLGSQCSANRRGAPYRCRIVVRRMCALACADLHHLYQLLP